MGVRDRVVSGLRRNFVGREELGDELTAVRNEARDLREQLDGSVRRVAELEAANGRLVERIEAVERSVSVLRAEDRALANTLSTLDQAVAGLRGGQPG